MYFCYSICRAVLAAELVQSTSLHRASSCTVSSYSLFTAVLTTGLQLVLEVDMHVYLL